MTTRTALKRGATKKRSLTNGDAGRPVVGATGFVVVTPLSPQRRHKAPFSHQCTNSASGPPKHARGRFRPKLAHAGDILQSTNPRRRPPPTTGRPVSLQVPDTPNLRAPRPQGTPIGTKSGNTQRTCCALSIAPTRNFTVRSQATTIRTIMTTNSLALPTQSHRNLQKIEKLNRRPCAQGCPLARTNPAPVRHTRVRWTFATPSATMAA